MKLISEGYHITLTMVTVPRWVISSLAYDHAKEYLPPMPLDVCGAQTQGMIGYMFQLSLKNILKGIDKSVVTILAQTIINPEDPTWKIPPSQSGRFILRSRQTNSEGERMDNKE